MMTTKRIALHFMLLFTLNWICGSEVMAQKQETVRYGDNDNGVVYTSLEKALKDPQHVYRLKLTKLSKQDSLPEELFLLTELRELTLKGCKLNIVNQRIGELTKLQYLNLEKNRILRLPNSIGNLLELRILIINRNLLETLPDSISRLYNLSTIDAWDNPLYVLPESISALENTLQVLDLRQIPLTKSEYEVMEQLLPKTQIFFTNICECENHRDHN